MFCAERGQLSHVTSVLPAFEYCSMASSKASNVAQLYVPYLRGSDSRGLEIIGWSNVSLLKWFSNMSSSFHAGLTCHGIYWNTHGICTKFHWSFLLCGLLQTQPEGSLITFGLSIFHNHKMFWKQHRCHSYQPLTNICDCSGRKLKYTEKTIKLQACPKCCNVGLFTAHIWAKT